MEPLPKRSEDPGMPTSRRSFLNSSLQPYRACSGQRSCLAACRRTKLRSPHQVAAYPVQLGDGARNPTATGHLDPEPLNTGPVWEPSPTIEFVEGVPATVSVRNFVQDPDRDPVVITMKSGRLCPESPGIRVTPRSPMTAGRWVRSLASPRGARGHLHGRRPETLSHG